MKIYSIVFAFILLPFFAEATAAPFAPPPLRRGDTIALIAPASFPEEDKKAILDSIKVFESRGYRVKVAPNLMSRNGYLAGTDTERAKAFMDAWRDPQVKGIWCYRGGYGSMRILRMLDYDTIRKNPKVFIGMSDVTALHAAINKETGLITYLGPNFRAVYGPQLKVRNAFNEKELWRIVADGLSSNEGKKYPTPESFPLKDHSVMTIQSGVARGRLTGGTLSLVTSLLGTPWEIDTRGKILVLEEVHEDPYRIDRMLCQLKLAGGLDAPAGVILSSWKGCKGKNPDKNFSLERIFRHYFSDVRYPVFVGFPSGHIQEEVTLPLNALAEIDASKKTLRLLESPVRVVN